MFPPAYSSEFNLIEGLWRWLKSSIINNSFFPTFPKVRVPVNKFIDEISCMSNERKEFYKKIINIRYKIIKEVYNKINNEKIDA